MYLFTKQGSLLVFEPATGVMYYHHPGKPTVSKKGVLMRNFLLLIFTLIRIVRVRRAAAAQRYY